jgi:hypothetical protein
MVRCLIKHGDNFVIKLPNRVLQRMFLYLQLAVLDTPSSHKRWGRSIEERVDFVARGMTGGHLTQWDRHSRERHRGSHPTAAVYRTRHNRKKGKQRDSRHFPTLDMENTVRSKINFPPRNPVTFMLRILEVPDPDLDQETDYPERFHQTHGNVVPEIN